MDTNELIEAIEDAGYTPSSYSGRGMFGARCVSVVLQSGHSAARFGLTLGARLGADAASLRPEEDSLGTGTVVYFPREEWPEGRPDPRDHEDSE